MTKKGPFAPPETASAPVGGTQGGAVSPGKGPPAPGGAAPQSDPEQPGYSNMFNGPASGGKSSPPPRTTPEGPTGVEAKLAAPRPGGSAPAASPSTSTPAAPAGGGLSTLQQRVKDDTVAVNKAREACLQRLAANPAYAAAVKAKEAASKKAHDLSTGVGAGDLSTATRELTDAMTRLSALQEAELLKDKDYAAAKARLTADQTELAGLRGGGSRK